MTQVLAPLCNRAYDLANAAARERCHDRHAGVMWRDFVFVAYEKGCAVREEDGRIVPVNAKWLVPRVKEAVARANTRKRKFWLRAWLKTGRAIVPRATFSSLSSRQTEDAPPTNPQGVG